jgi:hypothetical protein
VLDFAQDPVTGATRWILTREEEGLYRLWTPDREFLLDEDGQLIESRKE